MLDVLAREEAGLDEEDGFRAGDDFHCISASERRAFQQGFEADAAVVRFRLVDPELGEARKFFAARTTGAKSEAACREAVEGVAGDGAEVARPLEDGKFVHVIGRVDGVAQAETRPAEALTHVVGEFEFGGIKQVRIEVEGARVKDDFFGLATFDEMNTHAVFVEEARRQQVEAELGVGVRGVDGIGFATEADAPVLIVGQVRKDAVESVLFGLVGAFGAFLREGDDAAETVHIGFGLLGFVLSEGFAAEYSGTDSAGSSDEIPSVHCGMLVIVWVSWGARV